MDGIQCEHGRNKILAKLSIRTNWGGGGGGGLNVSKVPVYGLGMGNKSNIK